MCSVPTAGVLGNSDSKDVDRIHKKYYASLHEQVSLQDVCVGTSVGTVTEPDCLGPCEPGTSVTLEGIVWHETENGESAGVPFTEELDFQYTKIFFVKKS